MANRRTLTPPEKKWGIVVGVDNYRNANDSLRNLTGCVNDAKRMFETMTDADCCQFHAEHVKYLENPTREEIAGAFAEIGGQIEDDGEFWFYFAGHGYAKKRGDKEILYLLPSDASFRTDQVLNPASCISSDNLMGELIMDGFDLCNKVKNFTCVSFLDCCCAAAALTGGRDVGDIQAQAQSMNAILTRDIKAAKDSSSDSGVQFITFAAAGKNQKANEDSSGGAFTKQLIKGLYGGDENISTTGKGDDFFIRTGRLSTFLSERVPGQTPRQSCEDANFPLSIDANKKSKAAKKRELDVVVTNWLTALMNNGDIDTDEQNFANHCLYDGTGYFDFATAAKSAARTFAHKRTNPNADEANREGAKIIKALYALKRAMDNPRPTPQSAAPIPAPAPAPVPIAPPVSNDASLGRSDRMELKNLLRFLDAPRCNRMRTLIARLKDAIASDSVQKTVTALHEITHKWFLLSFRDAQNGSYRHLCDDDFQAYWHNHATREGINSAVQKAIYELIETDHVLSGNQ